MSREMAAFALSLATDLRASAAASQASAYTLDTHPLPCLLCHNLRHACTARRQGLNLELGTASRFSPWRGSLPARVAESDAQKWYRSLRPLSPPLHVATRFKLQSASHDAMQAAPYGVYRNCKHERLQAAFFCNLRFCAPFKSMKVSVKDARLRRHSVDVDEGASVAHLKLLLANMSLVRLPAGFVPNLVYQTRNLSDGDCVGGIRYIPDLSISLVCVRAAPVSAAAEQQRQSSRPSDANPPAAAQTAPASPAAAGGSASAAHADASSVPLQMPRFPQPPQVRPRLQRQAPTFLFLRQ
jgi:hypothetical protein